MGFLSKVIPEKELKIIPSREEMSERKLIVRIILCDRASLAACTEKLLLQSRRRRLDPLVGKILWRREWQSTPALLPGEFHGQRSLAGCSPWGRKKSDTTEQLHLHLLLWNRNSLTDRESRLVIAKVGEGGVSRGKLYIGNG